MRKRVTLLFSFILLVATQGSTFAQETQRSLFPLLGKKAQERGFTLPRPYGISVNYFYQNMDIGITGLELAAPMQETPIRYTEDDLTVERSEAKINSYTVRPDLWVFPFLNVYGIVGKTWTTTDVFVTYSDVAPPISTKADPDGAVYGFGAMLAGKVGPIWITIDYNHAWSELDILDEPAQVNNWYVRAGHKFAVGKNGVNSLNFWIGTSKQDFDTRNSGSYSVNAITPTSVSGVELTAQQRAFAAWNILGRMHFGQAAMDVAVPPGMDPNNPQGSSEYQFLMSTYPAPLEEEVSYGLEKTLDNPWNVLVGAQFEVNRRYSIRMEGGFLGDRTSFMTSLGVRMGK